MPDPETEEARAQRLFDRANKIVQLAEDVKVMDGDLKNLNTELQNERLWRRWLGRMMLLFSALFLAFMTYVIIQTTVSNRERDLILDCTTPTAGGDDVHVCYERGQDNTANAIQVIVDEVDRRTCVRIEDALEAALERTIILNCPTAPPTTTTTR